MRHLRRYGLFVLLLVMVVVATFALFACSSVDDSENENEIVKIRIGDFQKPEVYYGDEIDIDGATILATTRGGAVHTIPITKDMISNYDSHKIGDQSVTITYEVKRPHFKLPFSKPMFKASQSTQSPIK